MMTVITLSTLHTLSDLVTITKHKSFKGIIIKKGKKKHLPKNFDVDTLEQITLFMQETKICLMFLLNSWYLSELN